MSTSLAVDAKKPKVEEESLYNAFTPRNNHIDSELVVVDSGWDGRIDIASRYPAAATLTLNVIQVRQAWDEWNSMPVIVQKPTWFKRGGNRHCINVYLTRPNGTNYLHDRIVIRARDFDSACRCANEQVYSDPINYKGRTYFNAGTVEHYREACVEMDILLHGIDSGQVVDLRTDKPLNRAIREFTTKTGPGSERDGYFPRSYAHWWNALAELEELGLDLTTDNSARKRVLDMIMRDMAHNKWCAGQAENAELPHDTRSSMAVAEHKNYLPANIECMRHVLQKGHATLVSQ